MKIMTTTVLLALCLSSPLYAQVNPDSLEARLSQVEGAERLAVLADLVEALFSKDSEQALSYGREAVSLLQGDSEAAVIRRVWYWKGRAHQVAGQYDLVLVQAERLRTWAEAAGDAGGLGDASRLESIVHYLRGDYASSLEASEAALVHYEALGDKQGTSGSLNIIGLIYYEQGDYAEALSFYTRSLAIYEELGDKRNIAISLNNIGLIYSDQGDYAEALSFLTRSLTIQKELGDKRNIAAALNNIGVIYEQQGDYAEALSVYTRSLAIYKELGDKRNIAAALNNIGVIYKMQGDYAEALSFYTRSLAIREEIGDKQGIADTLKNIGLIYMKQGGYAEALSFYTRSLAIREEIGDKQGLATTLKDIGGLYLKQQHLAEALTSTDQALALADSIGALLIVRDAHEQRAQVLAQQGRFAEALTSHVAFKAVHDSLFTSESQSVIAELQQQYKTKEQQQQIQLLEQDRKIQRLWVVGLAGGLTLLALLAFFIYSQYRLRTRANIALQAANTEIAHKNRENEHLLLNILPEPIADRLKQGEETIADAFTEATVLFSDIVGFTQLSSRTSADALVDLLNGLFSAFDDLALSLGVEKIKTIGDAYMAVTGVPEHRADHAEVMVEMAQGMLAALERFNAERGTSLEIRIGISTGPVVAGVIGKHKFIYDLWGDAVNTASRMESHGVSGRVHVSGSTFGRLKDQYQYVFVSRGVIEVKGKGEMETYLLETRKEVSLASSGDGLG